jgi:hypothetical protein
MIMETDVLPATELAPPNTIRVETALSRYPVHRLAKKGNIKIALSEQKDTAGNSLRWQVTYNSEYGQPGPLAYKLDTLIINRKIEEATRPIPRIISLGSLKEIAAQLDLGGDTSLVKKALRQNASAFIIAKITYKKPDGRLKKLEADFTRYSVVFTGEELPDGRKADAVYILLNDAYMQVLNGAMTRPLDYDYLKNLPPAAQRFYELLSYQMYATIKNDRPRAKVIYSEFCTYAPQTRHFNWERVRSQMNKIYRPHKQSGYIADIDYEQTADSDGQPDWIMFYKPGPKARAEYRAFAKRGGPVMLEAEPFNLDRLPQLAAPEPSPLAARLVKRGVSADAAEQLVRDHTEEKIIQQIEILDWRLEGKKVHKIGDPAAWLVAAIKSPKGHAAPKGFKTQAQRQADEEAARQAHQKAVEASRNALQQKATETAAREAAETQIKQLNPEDRAALQAMLLAQADEHTRQMYEHPPTPTFADSMMHRMMLDHFQPSLPL